MVVVASSKRACDCRILYCRCNSFDLLLFVVLTLRGGGRCLLLCLLRRLLQLPPLPTRILWPFRKEREYAALLSSDVAIVVLDVMMGCTIMCM